MSEEVPYWWNLDLHLAKTIAAGLREFMEKSNGHPPTYSEKEWNDKLNSIATKLERYEQEKFSDTVLEVMETGRTALRELAEIFPYLWD